VERLVIRFFTDNNVPDSVAQALIDAGHKVTRLRDVMLPDSSDPVIAVACSTSGHVLVTHDNDFRGGGAAKRLGLSRREYRTKLHRIQMRCEEPRSARRIKDAMSLIEHEWQLLDGTRPIDIEIRDGVIRIMR
jgi:predicted nuclease of predicted toxin-antitoxin system